MTSHSLSTHHPPPWLIHVLCPRRLTLPPSHACTQHMALPPTQNMDDLNRFMALYDLPREMKIRLREYFHQTRHLQTSVTHRYLLLTTYYSLLTTYYLLLLTTTHYSLLTIRYSLLTTHHSLLTTHYTHRQLLRVMSPTLQGEVALKCNERWLARVPFLRGVEAALLVEVAMQLSAVVFAPGEAAVPGHLYIIHKAHS